MCMIILNWPFYPIIDLFVKRHAALFFTESSIQPQELCQEIAEASNVTRGLFRVIYLLFVVVVVVVVVLNIIEVIVASFFEIV